jgi:D-amino peptidase
MRVLISADMEGITGVTCPADVEPGTARWERAQRLLMSDVNAAIAGFVEAGATEIVVNEAHADKRNLLLDELDDRATAIIGTHKRLGMMEGVEGADAVAFVGYHTGAGRQGVLAHTYAAQTVLEVRVNGEAASEGRMNAMLAAEFGVPIVMVTGDDLTCKDAAAWAANAERVAVKECIDRYTAKCWPPARTAPMIREAAARGLAGLTPVSKGAGPFRYEVFFDAAQPVAACSAIPGVEETAERCVTFTLPTMHAAIRCFKAVTVIAKASVEKTFG